MHDKHDKHDKHGHGQCNSRLHLNAAGRDRSDDVAYGALESQVECIARATPRAVTTLEAYVAVAAESNV